jgi:hypothetical protein
VLKTLIEICNLPPKARVEKRMPKNAFYRNAEFSKQEVKTFVDKIQLIQVIAILNGDSLRVAPFVNEDYNISDIAYLLVELKDRGQEEKVARIIHAAIPYPLFIIFCYRQEVCFSTALKRLNKNDPTSVVLGDINISPWVDPVYPLPVQQAFLDSLALKTLPYDNLYRLYLALDNRIYLTGVMDLIGVYPSPEINVSAVQVMLDKIDELEKTIKNLNTTIKRETSFARQMEHHVQIQQLQQQLDALISQLREVC